MKKIRAIRTPNNEPVCRFVCIDEFDKLSSIATSYYCGVQVYEDSSKKLYDSPSLRFLSSRAIRREPNDVFEKPDIKMYVVLGQVLKTNGFVFNKKRGIINKIH